MTELTYSGMCLAAMFGSIIYEHRRLKKEEAKLRATLIQLAAENRPETATDNILPHQAPKLIIKTASC